MIRLLPITLSGLIWLGAISQSATGQTPPPAPTPAPAPAPTPTALSITGPVTVPVYTLGHYTVTGDATAKVAWLVMPNTAQVVHGQSLVMTGPPGTYTVIAFAVASGQPVIMQQAITISTGPGPNPTPTPTPKPTPPPIPVPSTTGPYYVAFVTDARSTTSLTAGQMALRNSTTMLGSLKALAYGNQWAPIVDVGSPTFPYSASAIKAGLPCIVIVGTDSGGLGFIVETISNPVDEPSVLAEIQRLAAGGVPH